MIKNSLIGALVVGAAVVASPAALAAVEATCSGSAGVGCTAPIPDFPVATPYTSNFTVTQPLSCPLGPLLGIGIRVNAVHANVGDLVISVTGPNGATTLLDRPVGSGAPEGCTGEDVSAVFVGSVGLPANSCQEVTIPAVSGNVLAAGPGIGGLQSTNFVGNWTLTVADMNNGGEGFVQDWAVRAHCGAAQVPAQTPAGMLAMALAVLGLGAWTLGAMRRR